jgi:serine protease Do
VGIHELKSLLERPNTVPMSRWLTIGALDPRQWTTLFGSRWQQRAGRIHVREAGQGFGGRSLCLWNKEMPKLPLEVAVSVRLEDESGAAGLVFSSDGGDRHYGFYPSSGRLRLSRFDGPDVTSWNVLREISSEHYRPGQWNEFKVRLEEKKILCFVNGAQVIESTDDAIRSGRVGLAKFRHTVAEFKRFRVGAEVPSTQLAPDVAARIVALVDKLPPAESLRPDQLMPLAGEAPASVAVLRSRAEQWIKQAEQLRRLAEDVHVQSIASELAAATSGPDDNIDLARAALLIARLDNDEVEIEPYLVELDRMAEEISSALPEGADDQARHAALNKYLFTDGGFHGSRTDYYHRANSHLNRVIDDREGLPITLAVLYMELGQRLNLRIEGVGLPGHFVVRFVPAKGEPRLLDVFEGGVVLSREDAAKKVADISGQTLRDEFLKPASNRAIIQRLLHNLLAVSQNQDDREAMLRYVEAMVAIDPKAIGERGMRAVLRYNTGRREAALADLDWFLDNEPDGVDLDRLREMRASWAGERR